MSTVGGVTGRIWFDDGFEPGWVAWARGRIVALGKGKPPRAHAGDLVSLGRKRVVPGFVDTLLHGFGGQDCGDATAEGLNDLSVALARTGVTAAWGGFYPLSLPALRTASAAWDEYARQRRAAPRTRLCGWHIEGPWIPKAMVGGLPATDLSKPSRAAASALMKASGGWLRMVTMAPELTGAVPAARALLESRVIPSIGHTACDYRAAEKVAALGRVALTHFGNRMPPLSAREPGPIGLSLEARLRWIGVIPDAVHVATGTLRMLANQPALAERLMFTSDNLSHAGLPARSFSSGGQRLHRDGPVARNKQGSLAGTLDSLPRMLLKRVADGTLTWHQAIRGGCFVPGALVGRCGRIEKGYRADAVCLDANVNVERVWVAGREVQ